MTPSLKRRLVLLLALLLAGVGLAFLAMGNLGKSLVYYWSPTELIESGGAAVGARVRLGGLVKEGSLEWDKSGSELRFVVTDETATVEVRTNAAPPDMFRENVGVLVEGTMTDSGYFRGDRLLVKHSNEYRAPTDSKHLEEAFRTVEGL